MLDPNNPLHIKSFDKCRNIKKEIIKFGVNDDEILKIIELLSHELENLDTMKSITSFLKTSSEAIESNKSKLII
jgi:hypothetical protein